MTRVHFISFHYQQQFKWRNKTRLTKITSFSLPCWHLIEMLNDDVRVYVICVCVLLVSIRCWLLNVWIVRFKTHSTSTHKLSHTHKQRLSIARVEKLISNSLNRIKLFDAVHLHRPRWLDSNIIHFACTEHYIFHRIACAHHRESMYKYSKYLYWLSSSDLLKETKAMQVMRRINEQKPLHD